MLMGLGLFTVAGVAGAIYYMVHNMIAKTAAFLAAGMVHRLRGTYELTSLGGLYARKPFHALLFLLPAMSLAGIPPLSGFVGKMYLVYAGLNASQYVITAVAILVSLLTLFSMLKIWNEVFWKPAPEENPGNPPAPGIPWTMTLPLAIMALLTLLLGVAGGPVIGWTVTAAEGIMNPAAYIDAVLKP